MRAQMPLGQPRIERVAQPVTQQVHRQHGDATGRSAGKNTMYGFTCQSARPSAMMLPQLGMIGGVPAPMNDSVASVIIAEAQMNVALHHQRRQRVRQDVLRDDHRHARAGRDRRLHIRLLAQR